MIESTDYWSRQTQETVKYSVSLYQVLKGSERRRKKFFKKEREKSNNMEKGIWGDCVVKY